MLDWLPWLLAIVFAVVASVAAAMYLSSRAAVAKEHQLAEERVKTAEERAQVALREIEAQRKEMVLQAKDQTHTIRQEIETEYRDRRSEMQRQERRLQQKEETLDRKLEATEKREKSLQTKERELEAAEAQLTGAREEQRKELERIAGLSAEEAKALLLDEIEDEVRIDANRRYRQVETEIKDEAEERIRKVLAVAAARAASEYVPEITVSSVPLPNEEMKGRIIGREGRNIRAIEQATGVDIIIDETPDAIIISCFNPIRREIAKVAIERLIADGRIHPARIQEIVEKTQMEFETNVCEVGERSAFDCGITGLNSELTTALGRLKYMTTGGQSVLQHCVETAQIAGIIAHELGLNVKSAQRAALLHDIGKSLPETIE